MPEGREQELRWWLDLVNTPEALFFAPIMRHLERGHESEITVRRRAETAWLASFLGLDHLTIGGDADGWLAKRIAIAARTFFLQRRVGPFHAALSFGNPNAVLLAKWRQRPNVVFEDNDLDWAAGRSLTDEVVRRIVWTSTFKVVPQAFPVEKLVAAGISEDSIYRFNGFKEQVYLADFEPDPGFHEALPVSQYVVVRPESLSSSYVSREPSLVPKLLRALGDRDIDVVYLPRTPAEASLLNGERAFVPQEPVFGPDLVWHAGCVLTGSGTMAREAACMGVPAVSFFNGRDGALLSVDRELIDEGKMIHTRDVDPLVDYVAEALAGRSNPSLGRSPEVQSDVVDILQAIVRRIESEDLPLAGISS